MRSNFLFKAKIKWTKWSNSHFFKYGFPFLVFMVGSSFALTEFTSVRYEVTALRQRSARKEGNKADGEMVDYTFDLTKVYEEMSSDLKSDYENIRGPRDYEDNSEAMELLKKKIEETQKSKQGVVVQALDLLMNK